MKQLVMSEIDSGQRLDKFLGKYLSEAPKSFIYKMLRKRTSLWWNISQATFWKREA